MFLQQSYKQNGHFCKPMSELIIQAFLKASGKESTNIGRALVLVPW